MALLNRRMNQWYTDLKWRLRNHADRAANAPKREADKVARIRRELPDPANVAPRRLLVDVSVIHKHDAGTGIQRVVRSIREELSLVVSPDVTVEHLVVRRLRDGYVTLDGQPVEGGPDALFLGLDFATDAVFRSRHQLQRLRESGTPLWFVVHDVLPMSHPGWFTPASQLKYRRWMRTCAALADGILCVSPDTARQVEDLLTRRYRRTDLPRIVTITPGSNISPEDRSIGTDRLPRAAHLAPETFAQAVLIVGTLEPRKGHADALDAFDLLWNEGHKVPLVLIGKVGWNTIALQRRIRGHEQFGKLLFWFDHASDDELHASYRHCRLTLVPSLAEGYGLPIDEALALGSPVLARDIPVFRRHAEGDVRYFPAGADPVDIAGAITAAIATHRPDRTLPVLRTWNDTAREIVQALGCERAHLPPEPLSRAGAQAIAE